MTVHVPAPIPADRHGETSRQVFLDSMARVAFSVSVVTTDGPAGQEGMTVTAMASVVVDDSGQTLLVSLHAGGRATRAIVDNGVFCVNVLGERQAALAERFAGRGEQLHGSRFEHATWSRLSTGAPALDGAIASFDCRLRSALPVREHIVVLGDVEATHFADGAPLVHWRRAYHLLDAMPL